MPYPAARSCATMRSTRARASRAVALEHLAQRRGFERQTVPEHVDLAVVPGRIDFDSRYYARSGRRRKPAVCAQRVVIGHGKHAHAAFVHQVAQRLRRKGAVALVRVRMKVYEQCYGVWRRSMARDIPVRSLPLISTSIKEGTQTKSICPPFR